MMTNERIKTILYKDVRANPVLGAIPEIEKDVHSPVEEATERIVVNIPGGVKFGKIGKGFVHVCVYVPDKKRVYSGNREYKAPNNPRLEELESASNEMFSSPVYGEDGDERYWYSLDSVTTEKDEATDSHFLNVRLLFEIANFKL